MTVVGVVPTIPRQFGPASERSDPAVYVPLQLDPSLRLASITVRADPGGERAVAATLREEVRGLDADLPLYAVALLTDVIAQTRSPVRLVGTWFSVLALIALVVASVGLFAITAHGVAQRTQEIGVRLALGAQSGQVSWLFLRRTLGRSSSEWSWASEVRSRVGTACFRLTCATRLATGSVDTQRGRCTPRGGRDRGNTPSCSAGRAHRSGGRAASRVRELREHREIRGERLRFPVSLWPPWPQRHSGVVDLAHAIHSSASAFRSPASRALSSFTSVA